MAEPSESIVFPDGPRSELDRALTEVVVHAKQVLETQGRLRSLLDANRLLIEELDLPTVLRRVVEVAVRLVGARYGALGVIAPDGHLEQFIHVGADPGLLDTIGHLPEGHGLLGALIDDPRPIRLGRLGEDPRSSGFPDGHPPMQSFLGVPVRVRAEIYGNLYLADEAAGAFSAEDEELLRSLATTAGIAIDTARLFDETHRRQRWSSALAEVTRSLLSGSPETALGTVADALAGLVDAEIVCVVVAGELPGTARVDTARGRDATRAEGRVFPLAGTLVQRAWADDTALLADAGQDDPPPASVFVDDDRKHDGPMMAVPLAAGGQGALIVTRTPGSARFTDSDLGLAADFAAQASLALELAHGRRVRERLALLEDRGRIARDLHDHVIQRLFGTGLALQSLLPTIDDPVTRLQLDEQVTALDDAIAQIRTAVFTLSAPAVSQNVSVRHRVIDTIAELSAPGIVSPRLTFTGPVDLLVPEEMIADIVAVLREGLSNVTRHAGASETDVAMVVDPVSVSISIDDDGVGPGTGSRRSGTLNLAHRAEARGGSCTIEQRKPRGTSLRWTVPLAAIATPR